MRVGVADDWRIALRAQRFGQPGSAVDHRRRAGPAAGGRGRLRCPTARRPPVRWSSESGWWQPRARSGGTRCGVHLAASSLAQRWPVRRGSARRRPREDRRSTSITDSRLPPGRSTACRPVTRAVAGRRVARRRKVHGSGPAPRAAEPAAVSLIANERPSRAVPRHTWAAGPRRAARRSGRAGRPRSRREPSGDDLARGDRTRAPSHRRRSGATSLPRVFQAAGATREEVSWSTDGSAGSATRAR